MDYIRHHFIGEDVILDYNTFESCVFERCVLHYNGGDLQITNSMEFRVNNRVEYGTGVDPYNNPLSNYIVSNMLRQGGTIQADVQRPEDRPEASQDQGA